MENELSFWPSRSEVYPIVMNVAIAYVCMICPKIIKIAHQFLILVHLISNSKRIISSLLEVNIHANHNHYVSPLKHEGMPINLTLKQAVCTLTSKARVGYSPMTSGPSWP